MKNRIVTLTDSYKFGHHQQYPPDTQAVYSYWEARQGAAFPETVFFGLQYFIKEYLEGVVVTRDDIEFGAELSKAHFGTADIFNGGMWTHIVDEHGGRLPIRIKAVPEGMVVPVSNVMMTIENTCVDCAPLTNHLETLLCQLWASCTVATLSREVKKMMLEFVKATADNEQCLDFMLHDFGFRGVSSVESAGIEGAGHLLNFLGTDTVKAMEVAHEYYGAPLENLAFSVPATEHSVMTALGRDGEVEIVGRLLKQYPTGILSIVADSYDVYNFAGHILGEVYKDEILARDGRVVCRPDSGDPVGVTLDVLDILAVQFGTTPNRKGYRVLPPQIGVLWGDGIDKDGIEKILEAMQINNWSAENIVFGMGGGLLQKINRDTQRFAFKSSAQKRDGVWHDVYKEPLEGGKQSKRGRLKLVRENGTPFETVPCSHPGQDLLTTVFEDGRLIKEHTFEEVRNNVRSSR
jgi:nicotinamide phosphoribosyltransferase